MHIDRALRIAHAAVDDDGLAVRRNEQESKDRNGGAPAIRRQAPENVEDVWNFGLQQAEVGCDTPNETPLFEIHHFDVSSAAGDAGRASRQVTQAKSLIAPPQRRRHHETTPCNGGVARRVGSPAALTAAVAQDAYPTRPVRIVVGFPAGTATDITTRIYAEKLSGHFNQRFIVENMPGAATNLAAAHVARAAPTATRSMW